MENNVKFDPKLYGDLLKAYRSARKHKANTYAQVDFQYCFGHNFNSLYEEIYTRTYRPGRGICFIIERPIKREVFASPFRDRVVHHLIFNYIAPIFERKMIYDSYSCRVGKGTLMGIERFEHHLRSCTDNFKKNAYILKLDLRGYFMSINKNLLYSIISKTLKKCQKKWPKGVEHFDCDLVDYLIRRILLRNPTYNCKIMGRKSDWQGLPSSKSLFSAPKGVGLPIGDLTSQLFSNIYLDVLDQFVKRELKCKHYGRYVDDFYIIHEDREFLRSLIPRLRTFLKEKLCLTLHPKKITLQHYSKGISFLGAKMRPYRRYVSARTVGFFHRAMNDLEKECAPPNMPSRERIAQMLPIINSYCGYCFHFKAYKLLNDQFAHSSIKRFFTFNRKRSKAKIVKEYRLNYVSDEEYEDLLSKLLPDVALPDELLPK